MLVIEATSLRELESFWTKLLLTTVYHSWEVMNTLLFSHLSSWNKLSCKKPANYQTLKRTCTRSSDNQLMNQTIWLLLQSSQSQLSTEMSGLNQEIFHSNTAVLVHASERKQVLTEKMYGVSSEFINLKKLSNSVLPLQKNHGKCMKKWSRLLNNSIKNLNFLTELLTSFQENWMMQLQRNTIWKLGSQDMILSENLFHAQTVPTSNQELWK